MFLNYKRMPTDRMGEESGVKHDVPDEFDRFLKASIHPPNELSVPRCYPSVVLNSPICQHSKSLGASKSQRSLSITSQKSFSSGSSMHSSRPRLQRESAQDFDDADINPNINIEFVDSNSSPPPRQHSGKRENQRCSIVQRSAPGTPLHRSSYSFRTQSPSRANSDESGHLQVPLSRTRGISLPNCMEESLVNQNTYLLRQFNLKGRKVIHLGDSYHGSNASLSSAGSCGYVSSMFGTKECF